METNTFTDKYNRKHILPFDIVLSDFQIQYYAGTHAPSNYVSTFTIKYDNKEIMGQVSMNNFFFQKGFRFYQSGYDKDEQGSVLLVKSDKYGLPLIYLGFFLLLVTMISYFFTKNTKFREYLKHPALKQTSLLLLFFLLIKGIALAETKNTLPYPIAKKMSELHILYNDRICPIETFAQDFTLKLYGKSTYKSFSSLQVLTGWLFFSQKWKNEPIIKIKDKKIQQLLGINGKYASFSDFFFDDKQYKLTESLVKIQLGENCSSTKNIIAADEKIQLLLMLQIGVLLKVFPIEYEQNIVWLSPADELPENLSKNEQLLIRCYFDLLKEYAIENDWKSMETTLKQLILFQKKSAKGALISPQKMKAEHLYNKINKTKPLAFCNLFIGIIALIYCFRREKKGGFFSLLTIFMLFGGLFILLLISLRDYISGHIPLKNGFETMQFLAFCILFLAFFFRQKSFLSLPFGLIFSGLVLLVSVMGASSPQITQLQPVLKSPLLSIHVSVIMIAYALFGFITFNSIISFIYLLFKSDKNDNKILQLYVISRIFLYPAVCLLATGIIVGAMWAEISWGRYWSWDPKETWALITLILYALPLHSQKLRLFEKPFFFHLYMIISFLSVLMTYFGVNYLLGGMHTYMN
jgi:ABC-type transport system involved in cytochrome c biogenesis permease subunit